LLQFLLLSNPKSLRFEDKIGSFLRHFRDESSGKISSVLGDPKTSTIYWRLVRCFFLSLLHFCFKVQPQIIRASSFFLFWPRVAQDSLSSSFSHVRCRFPSSVILRPIPFSPSKRTVYLLSIHFKMYIFPVCLSLNLSPIFRLVGFITTTFSIFTTSQGMTVLGRTTTLLVLPSPLTSFPL